MQDIQARKSQRMQHKKEMRALAHKTQTGFEDYFAARRQRQAGRRWAEGLPGAEQIQATHETQMQEIHARNLARRQHKKEMRSLAQNTQDSFAAYFAARKQRQADRRWAQGLPGAEQAQSIHEMQMQEVQERKLARMQHQKEMHALAQKTQTGFADYFAARKQRQDDRRWAEGLPGAEQAQAAHAIRMQEIQEKKLARMQHKKEVRAQAQKTQDSFAGYFAARRQRQADRRWAKGLPGAEQAQSIHETQMQEIQARKIARRGWAKGLPGAQQAQSDHEARMQEFEARKLVRLHQRQRLASIDNLEAAWDELFEKMQ